MQEVFFEQVPGEKPRQVGGGEDCGKSSDKNQWFGRSVLLQQLRCEGCGIKHDTSMEYINGIAVLAKAAQDTVPHDAGSKTVGVRAAAKH